MVPYLSQYLNLDQIISAGEYHFRTWSPSLRSNQAWPILRHIIYRLWDIGRGQLVKARFTCAQASLSAKLGISKRWVNVLCHRLTATGWLRYETHMLPDGTNSSCIWQAGKLLSRLLLMLQKSRQRYSQPKKSNNSYVDQSVNQSSPLRVNENERLETQDRSGASRTEERRQGPEGNQERLVEQERDRALLLQPQVYSKDTVLNGILNRFRGKVAGQK